MKRFINPLKRVRPGDFAGRMAEIKGWTRAALDLGDEVVVSVNELACAQADCPPRQTVILILRTGAPAQKLAIHKAMLDVSESDVVAALAGVGKDG